MNFKYLVFNHIPKCGGTSFREMFYDACRKKDNFFFNKPIYISSFTHDNMMLNNLNIKILSPDTKLFIDHNKYHIIEDLFNISDNQCYRITCIREPVSRILSHNSFFTKIPVESLLNDQHSFDRLINTCGKLLMWYATPNSKQNIKNRYELAYDIYKNNYNFIFRLENLITDIDTFNQMNPFNLKLCYKHSNINKKKENYPYQLIEKIKLSIEDEIKLYEKLKLLKTDIDKRR